MKPILPLVLTTFTALLFAGCETSGVSARIKEKSTTYAALAPAQQKLIQSGGLDVGYTPDMVYLSLGKPAKVETQNTQDGPVTVWTYTRFYPTDAVAKDWSASPNHPATFRVLFYEDKVFDAVLKQTPTLLTVDSLSRGFPERRQTPGMAAAGIYPNPPAPVSTPPGVGK